MQDMVQNVRCGNHCVLFTEHWFVIRFKQLSNLIKGCSTGLKMTLVMLLLCSGNLTDCYKARTQETPSLK